MFPMFPAPDETPDRPTTHLLPGRSSRFGRTSGGSAPGRRARAPVRRDRGERCHERRGPCSWPIATAPGARGRGLSWSQPPTRPRPAAFRRLAPSLPSYAPKGGSDRWHRSACPCLVHSCGRKRIAIWRCGPATGRPRTPGVLQVEVTVRVTGARGVVPHHRRLEPLDRDLHLSAPGATRVVASSASPPKSWIAARSWAAS